MGTERTAEGWYVGEFFENMRHGKGLFYTEDPAQVRVRVRVRVRPNPNPNPNPNHAQGNPKPVGARQWRKGKPYTPAPSPATARQPKRFETIHVDGDRYFVVARENDTPRYFAKLIGASLVRGYGYPNPNPHPNPDPGDAQRQNAELMGWMWCSKPWS